MCLLLQRDSDISRFTRASTSSRLAHALTLAPAFNFAEERRGRRCISRQVASYSDTLVQRILLLFAKPTRLPLGVYEDTPSENGALRHCIPIQMVMGFADIFIVTNLGRVAVAVAPMHVGRQPFVSFMMQADY